VLVVLYRAAQFGAPVCCLLACVPNTQSGRISVVEVNAEMCGRHAVKALTIKRAERW
jgi:hypothetical protein